MQINMGDSVSPTRICRPRRTVHGHVIEDLSALEIHHRSPVWSKTQNQLCGRIYNPLSICVQPVFGELSSLCSHGYLLLALLSPFYFFQDVLEHLKTHCRWMTHDVVLGPVMEVMRKGVDGTVVRRVIPPLDQQAVTILQ